MHVIAWAINHTDGNYNTNVNVRGLGNKDKRVQVFEWSICL